VTRSALAALRHELTAVKAAIADNTAAIDTLNRECATNLRRCAELQVEIDHIRRTNGL
jgi:hypothetical protein